MDVRCRFMAVDERNDVRVMKALEDVDLKGEVLLEFLVEL